MPPKKKTLSALIDFAREVNEALGNFQQMFTLAPDKLRLATYCVSGLKWHSIKFDPPEFDKLPDNKRGVYALVLYEPNAMLPPHGYVLYIGIAGRDSDRSLRERCKDYLNEKKLIKDREGIAYIIGNWGDILHLFYAPVDSNVSSADLQQLEKELNGALLPPYSRGDIEAKTKKQQKAFK